MKKILIFLVFLGLFTALSSYSQEVKDADLAGSWYPASRAELEAMLSKYLDEANPPKIEGETLAVIVPHAGYQFSAPVAAYAFKALEGKPFKTVIIIGFSHRRPFNGISVYENGAFRTPLGDVAIDEGLAKAIIASNKRIRFVPDAFKEENSVEMEIPFVQKVFKDAKIVPIAFGTQDYEDAEILAEALAKVLKDRRDVLIVASTDLSHYHPYDEANSIDKHTINTIFGLKAKELYDEGGLGVCELCGLMPVTATLILADKLGYDKVKTLKYANSGDTSGDKTRVVGYAAMAVYKESGREKEEKGELPMLNETQRKRLLQVARESITSYVRDGEKKTFTESDPVLNKPMGAFVTLHEKGELRGCIGNMVGQGPLYKTVADMAIESATGDPRFPALSAAEIGKIDIEISVLSEMKKVKSSDEVKIPGHGVMMRRGFAGGVFLPQVADETGWSKEEFLSNLCAHKAGLPADAWKDPRTDIYVFTAEVFGEKQRIGNK